MPADPDLHADNDIAIGLNHIGRSFRAQQVDVSALRHFHAEIKTKDPGMGDVKISKNPNLGTFNHMLAKSGEVTGPGGTRVDGRCNA